MKSYSTLFLLVSILLILQSQNIDAQENQVYTFKENISYRTADEEKQDEYIAERCKLDFYKLASAVGRNLNKTF